MLVPGAKLCVVIVSYGRPADIRRCLAALASSHWRDFAVFICENAGMPAYERLRTELAGADGPLEAATATGPSLLDQPVGRFTAVSICRLRGTAVPVRIGSAVENFGYGGGVNAWLDRLRTEAGWDAVLVLNPDTEVDPNCLDELIAKAAEGYGMVGASLIYPDAPDLIQTYGLIWSRLTGRVILAGRGAPLGSEPSSALLRRLDAASGACTLVTRAFVEDVGGMVEDYFLYMEDLDWGMRRGRHRIGFAAKAIVRHVGGTSIGSSGNPRLQSRLSSYLMARNMVRFSRRLAGPCWVLHLAAVALYAVKFFVSGAPAGARETLVGMIDGIRGKEGRPTRFDQLRHG